MKWVGATSYHQERSFKKVFGSAHTFQYHIFPRHLWVVPKLRVRELHASFEGAPVFTLLGEEPEQHE